MSKKMKLKSGEIKNIDDESDEIHAQNDREENLGHLRTKSREKKSKSQDDGCIKQEETRIFTHLSSQSN